MQFSKISSNIFNGDRDTLNNGHGTNFEAESGTKLDRDKKCWIGMAVGPRKILFHSE